MKKKSARLAPVLQLKKMKEEQAVINYTKAKDMLTLELQKLEQLTSYSNEYAVMIEQDSQASIIASKLNSYHNFLSRLNQAITQQYEQIELAKNRVQQYKNLWLQQRSETKNMDKLISRSAQQEVLEQNKKEQQETDEYTQQLRPAYQ